MTKIVTIRQCFRNRKSAFFTAVFVAFIASHSAAASTLKLSNTAQAYWKRALRYDWSATRLPVDPIPSIGLNQTKQIRYAISAKREFVEQTESRGAIGEICVTNAGDETIDRLEVTAQIQFKMADTGGWEPLPGAEQTHALAEPLAPTTSQCFRYDVGMSALEGAPTRDAEYRSVAIATNYDGKQAILGPSMKMEASTEITLPAKPFVQETDEKAALVNVIFCPSGFNCKVADTSWSLLESGDIDVLVQMTNQGIACGKSVLLENELVLTETDTQTERREASQVVVPTGACEPTSENPELLPAT